MSFVHTRSKAALGIALLLITQPVTAVPAQEISRGPMSIEIAAPITPMRTRAGGKDYLVYELHLTNFVPDRTMTLDGIEVLDRSGNVLQSLDQTALVRNLRIIGAAAPDDEPTRLAAGQRAILFQWVPVAGTAPDRLTHRVKLHIEGVSKTYLIDGTEIAIDRKSPRILTPPLSGGPWITANGPNPADVPSHNQLLYPGQGIIHIPQRFATDWISLGPNRSAFAGPIDQNRSYAAYGVPVLAVADAKVIEVHNGVAENRPPEVTEKLGQADRAGNYIILDIGGGEFAFYGHLKPGSMKVKAGDSVAAGQVIGALGNSGNSTGPHLHFHVTDGASFGSEGRPFVFNRYDDLGALDISLDDIEQGKPTSIGKSVRKSNDLPLGSRIVRF